MNFPKIAEQTIAKLGGKENITTLAHCATRLRLTLADESKVDKEAIENIEGVKGQFSTSGQYQIIFGSGTVNKVHAEMQKQMGIGDMSTAEVAAAGAANQPLLQRIVKGLADIFVPFIPAIVAAGLLMGILGIVDKVGLGHLTDTWWFMLLDMFSSAAFNFLPILIAISAAKQFKCNPYLAATIGGIMIHPALQNAWTSGTGYETVNVLGIIDMPLLGYQGTVLPILIVIFVMSYIEKYTRKYMPKMLDILLTPLITVLVTGFLALVVIGPIANTVGSAISTFFTYALNNFGIFAGLLLGGSYSSIVITGIHHSFHAVELELIGNTGFNSLLPIWSMANVAQGGAAFAVYFLAKNKKTKAIALPSAISCLFGVTEAAIFGVNMKYGRPFIGAAIGGALGGAYIVFSKVVFTAVGVTGLPALAISAPGTTLNYLIAMGIAVVGAFIATWILGIKED